MRTLRATVPLLGLLLLAACSTLRERALRMPQLGGSAYTASQLHDALARWAGSFQGQVTAACDRIREATHDRAARRSCLLWQLRMVPLAKRAAFLPDPQEAYVSSVALASAQRVYLEQGEGRALFGDQQPIANQAAQQVEEQAFAIGRAFLSEAQIARLDHDVDALVAAHPIGGAFATDALITSFSGTARTTFGWILNLPMVPFRALSGVSDTAQAVNQFDETARAFTETVGQLPPLTRAQLELLLYDAEELESVERALRAAESFASGAERISSAAQTLPDALGAQLGARLEEARGTIAELDRALARAEALAGPLAHVSDRLGDASAQWSAILARPEPGAPGRDSGRPFDVREYESAADRIGAASQDLRALVAELNALDPARLEALLDRVAWRAAILVCVFFAALAASRVATARLRPRGTG